MTAPTAPRGAAAYPGISQFLAEAPPPGHGSLWQLNGCMEGEDPNDVESWGWIADVTTGFGHESGDLAKHIARAVNAHAPLVEALAGLVELRMAEDNAELDGPMERWFTAKEIDGRWAAAYAALALARGEVQS